MYVFNALITYTLSARPFVYMAFYCTDVLTLAYLTEIIPTKSRQ